MDQDYEEIDELWQSEVGAQSAASASSGTAGCDVKGGSSSFGPSGLVLPPLVRRYFP
jgi:hypothetical protein